MRKTFVFLFLSLMLPFAFAATYYVQNANPNCNDALTTAQNSINTPWCTVSAANSKHSSGDTVYFMPKPDGTAAEYRERMIPKPGLSNSQRTVYSGYGDRSKVLFLGSEVVTGWTQHSGFIWSAPFTGTVAIDCTGYADTNCWYDRKDWFLRGAVQPVYSLSDLNAKGEYYYDDANHRVYVWMPDDSDPRTHQIECSKNVVIRTGEYTSYPASNYFTLQNLTIMQTRDRGFYMDYQTHDVTIQNTEFMFTTGCGFESGNPAAIIHASADTPATNIKIIGNKIHDIGSNAGPINDPRIDTFDHRGAGIELYSVRDSLIEGNEVYKTPNAIYLKTGNRYITVKNNIIHDTKNGIDVGRYQIGGQTSLPAGEFPFVSRIDGNLVYNVDYFGISIIYGFDHSDIFSNTVYNSGGDIGILWDDTNQPIGLTYGVSSNISNNILYNNHADPYSSTGNNLLSFFFDTHLTSKSDYNLFYDSSDLANLVLTSPCRARACGGTQTYSTLQAWQATQHDQHSWNLNPLVTNVNSLDFSLQSNSPAINKGNWIFGYHCARADNDPNPYPASDTSCRHWRGSSPDIGAFEYTGTTVDNFAPSRSSGSPSGILPYGTPSITLSLSTNEVSLCRYSTSPGAAFSSMNAFSSTNSFSHSQIIAVANGQSYNYYVKCRDSSNNVNSDDYQISFSVSNTASSPSPSTAPSPSIIPSVSPSASPSTSPVSPSPSASACPPTITVDSSYGGYLTSMIDNNDLIDPTGYEASTWASDDNANPHWVEKSYCTPTTINNLTIWWAAESTFYTSQTIQVQYYSGSSWQTIATMPYPGANRPISSVAFAPTSATRWRLYQPANQGATNYLGILWLAEIEFKVVSSPSPSIIPSPSVSIIPSPSVSTNPSTNPSISPSPSIIPCTENWSCTDWSACSNGTQNHVCLDLNSCGTTLFKPADSQSCNVIVSPSPSVSIDPSASITPCIESWSCTGFNACSGGSQSQLCTDANNCGTIVTRPPLTQSCTVANNGGGNNGGGSGNGNGGYVPPVGTATTNPTPSIKASVKPSATIPPSVQFITIKSEIETSLPDLTADGRDEIQQLLNEAERLQKTGNTQQALVLLNRAKTRLNDLKTKKADYPWQLGLIALTVLIGIGIYYFKQNSIRK